MKIPEEVQREISAAESACKKSKAYSAGYALTYIKAIPAAMEEAVAMSRNSGRVTPDTIPDPSMDQHEAMNGLRVQLLYILGNLGWWRGSRAREAKSNLKNWLNHQKLNRMFVNGICEDDDIVNHDLVKTSGK